MTIVPTCLGAIAVGRKRDRGWEEARSPFTTDPSATLPECEEIVATEKFAALHLMVLFDCRSLATQSKLENRVRATAAKPRED